MTQHLIHILPPQLANQIAAGEVVERPASVVKELVENSLDAGANQIQIDIEKGGAQLIRIRDNGCGISKQDLALALARHATSKISDLEDLEMILSLGFRGEALASISSVSRLTLTSRPEGQAEAWQAYAQGREMEVEIRPASHPVGTTIEVANLFFNTPARRKFLRTDKTEFAHIDEVVRRIALAKPNISFTLTHNGKTVRQYRKVQDNSVEQQQRRVAAICGDEFIQNAIHIDWQHGDLHLHGWIGSPNISRPQNDLCYSYVNGRMMRDKTINHAIRQAYEATNMPAGHYPAFVVFLDIDPSQVDVNVHPAKHEVRFHQGRLVHDFILQGVQTALQGQAEIGLTNQVNEPLPSYQRDTNRIAAGSNSFLAPQQAVEFAENFAKPTASRAPSYSLRTAITSKSAQKWYGELVGKPQRLADSEITDFRENKPSIVAPVIFAQEVDEPKSEQAVSATTGHWQPLAIVQNQALLLKAEQQFYLLSLEKLARLRFQMQLAKGESQALLIPLTLSLDEAQTQHWQVLKTPLTELGFSISEKAWQGQTRLSIAQVPRLLREQNLQQILLGLLDSQAVDLAQFFAKFAPISTAYSLAEAVNWAAETEQLAKAELDKLKVEIDFSSFLAAC
ncbi:DNA mismatch repair endonuclease MutL [Actinobacillus equuli]|uniref:DNA mismatch repair endonuclease MutL n=1 Tax=Actinobacillus equuli TaxID=718 RepID=UPI00244167DB|nr:DNA mismatch repair endonuclease MutL [Actinobacillus equuli]WGE74805.1 DNA mismatch repair endonuclease MutL [Actinobacillus equuli subsp. haemolyticus]WGE76718.1 DNA mismatch repair endonuclease MutL [Actinobacillus equuli subsp. haemolyticus]